MPQSSSVNPANRGRINLATVGPGNSADLIYNVRKHQRALLSQQQQQSADNGQVRSGSGHNSLTRTTRRSGQPSRPTGQTSGQVLMSRSASQAPSHQSYASPTASSTSRSHQRQLAAARSLSRSHEERSPRTGRRVIQPAGAVTSNKNGLNRGHAVPHQYQHTVQVQVPVVVQQPSPHSSPSKNALAASITAQVSIGTYLLSIELVANH